jgi:hypothetical protein
MRRQFTVVAGLVIIAAFATFARTGGPEGVVSAPIATGASNGGQAGGGEAGLPVGAPQSGPPGDGVVTASGAIQATYRFSQVSCIRSPNGPTGMVAKAISDPHSPSPVTINVSTDSSTLTLIDLQISASQEWTVTESDPPPQIRQSGKTITFSGRLHPTQPGADVSVRGSLTCGPIITLG